MAVKRAGLAAGIVFALMLSSFAAAAEEDLLGFQRMGAGAPGGWLVKGDAFTWTPESESGPLGIGAARIEFKGEGRIEVVSPARVLRGGAAHAVAFWARCDKPGGSCAVSVRDNDGEEVVGIEKSVALTVEWQLITVQGVLPPALKGRYYLALRAQGRDCTVWLDGLWLGERVEPVNSEWRPATFSAGLALTPTADWGLVTGAKPMAVMAAVVGATEEGARLEMRAVNTNGIEIELPPVPLDTAGVWKKEIAIDGDAARAFGMLRVEGTVVSPRGEPLSPPTETLLARVPEPVAGPLPESVFGVHVSLREPDVAVAAALGYKWCRIHDADSSTKWGRIEPEKGKWIWHDEKLAMVRGHGLSIVGMLDTAPPWETGADADSGYFSVCHAPADIENWRHYVRQVVGHYRGAIDEWEVWNEPWDMFRFFQGGTPQVYVDLLKAAFEETKKINPAATIIGIDTYPPMWENAVLASGAYPYYDLLSWHRYDPTLNGRPNDSVSRVAKRLERAQAPYGPAKPILCTEGGPDVTVFHGSFFSFAEPVITGDWSEGADRLARMYLSMLASGNRRFILYSIHNEVRHGLLTHMLVEPGPLLRPGHVAVAALAHFVEGAAYEGRLVPAHDISAHVFAQPNARPYAASPSMVVALITDGNESEPLPNRLPAGVSAFDRWANPCPLPTRATRGITYLVATGDARAALRKALDGPAAPAREADVESLLRSTIATLTSRDAPLWPLFSTQTALAVTVDTQGVAVMATRAQLRDDPAVAAQFRLPATAALDAPTVETSGEFNVGFAEIAVGTDKRVLSFSAVKDGPGGGWRYMSLTLMPCAPADDGVRDAVTGNITAWARAMREARITELYGSLYDGPCALASGTANGDCFVFSRGEHLLAMMNTAVVWGPATKSEMTFSRIDAAGPVAAAFGHWDLQSLAFGTGQCPVAVTLVMTDDGWKIAALCAGMSPPGQN